jgi:hypothetical protein
MTRVRKLEYLNRAALQDGWRAWREGDVVEHVPVCIVVWASRKGQVENRLCTIQQHFPMAHLCLV